LAAGLFVHAFGWPPIPLLLIPMVIVGLFAVAMLRPKLAGERG